MDKANRIGLKRETVRLVDHDPIWLAMAAASSRRIRRRCGDLIRDIQHVGSTSVADLPAKPILDLLIGVKNLAVVEQLAPRLQDFDYQYRGQGEGSVGHVFVRESAPHIRTEHIHVVEFDRPHWRVYIDFRDALRDDAVLRAGYAALKQDLQSRFANDRKAYTAAKHEFIQTALGQFGSLSS
ncbi:MAG: GrpB family protein [Candidatus Latescibacteria bacterium]|nr:GrpB family protein [Candidatus Latescibacterota bacterium]